MSLKSKIHAQILYCKSSLDLTKEETEDFIFGEDDLLEQSEIKEDSLEWQEIRDFSHNTIREQFES